MKKVLSLVLAVALLLSTVITAVVVFLLAYLLYGEVIRENKYLSRTVEVVENQTVIDTGLYGIIRHPMYLATVFMFILEEPTWQQIKDGWLAIAYAGIMSSGVAFTFQVLAQKRTNPTMASLLMSLESVFAVIGGIVIQQVMPTAREAAGCIIMFAAIVVAQIEFPKRKKRAVYAFFFLSFFMIV